MDMYFRIFGTTWYLADTRKREPGSEIRPEAGQESLLLFSDMEGALGRLREEPGLCVHRVLIPDVKGNVVSVTRTGENGEETVDACAIRPRWGEFPVPGGGKEEQGALPHRCRVMKAMVRTMQPDCYAVVEAARAEGESVTPDDCQDGTVFQGWEALQEAVRRSGSRGKVFRVEIDGGITLKEHVADARGGDTIKVGDTIRLRQTTAQPETPANRQGETPRESGPAAPEETDPRSGTKRTGEIGEPAGTTETAETGPAR